MRIPASMAAKPHTEPQFRFEVALAESGVLEGEALLETLGQLVSVAEQTAQTLIPLYNHAACFSRRRVRGPASSRARCCHVS